MIFNDHYKLNGKHAFLSASKYAWLRYDEEKLADVFANHMDADRGTRLHNFAKQAIDLGIKLPRSNKTLNAYINDAIGYRMTPEQVLYYSDNIFGTADTISFRKDLLRISDLKTGVSKASMDQLQIYAAMFCLEYNENPAHIEIELRIYQNDVIDLLIPDLDDIREIMKKIIDFDKLIEQMKVEAESGRA